ncbi:HEAT repeat domain-containing protein [Prosthecobacter fluviatilis]|uniref:HEAT repeat domain-containing protein n=1 Tax=Prosthecobacter fluviatilis TaxID=445931 RepID=A0ABW0KPQ8_9BACT
MKMPPLLSWLCLAVPLFAEQALPLEEHWPAKEPVPAGVKLTLRMPETVVIGQEMPAALVVRNEGGKPFEITPGGDYRTTGYPQRMKVRVHDTEGKMLPELSREAYGFGGGGISAPRSIAPGASDEVEFPLDCYVSFKMPGIYTVTAGHDLGWKVDPVVPHPEAKKSVQVVLPSEREAEAYVEAVYARQPPPGDNPEALRSQWELEKTLSVLRHPVYLRVLVRHARAGSKAAVKGIGHIATPEATEALLELLGHASADVVETSCQQLLRRLPSLEDGGKPVERFYWGSPYQIEPLLPASWEVRFEQPLLKAVLKLLWHKSDAVVQCAGLLLQSRAQPENATQVLEVLQQVLSVRHELCAGPKANTLDPPMPLGVLLGVLDGMRKRGWRLENGNGHMAHQVAWLRQLADKEVPKPKGEDWKAGMLSWVEYGSSPTLKVCALQAIPQPLSDDAAKAVYHALDDQDWRVQRIACEVAGASKRAEFCRPLAQIIELEHEDFLQNAAHNAALACGGGLELWEAWAGVIPDQDRMYEAVRALMIGTIQMEVVGSGGGNSNFTREQRFAIRDAWRAFLRKHEKQLAEGGKVAPPGAATAAALTGGNFNPSQPVTRFTLKDGSQWPPSAGK